MKMIIIQGEEVEIYMTFLRHSGQWHGEGRENYHHAIEAIEVFKMRKNETFFCCQIPDPTVNIIIKIEIMVQTKYIVDH
jgi:hypothetical protein